MAERDKIIKINIEEEMKKSYIDYSMSVIVSRALPDVRDGLKPVHRRVLYGMLDLGVLSNRPYKKSARIVGEVLGKYHPHGDTSVYDAMVRMAQEWSLRYPLVDGQGNFGSVDGDSPAAMRYTEARLKKIAEEMLLDIDKDTIDFRLNFDDSLQEPTVLPSKIPNLLINGSSGIAVGMATNMPPHNITEVINACIAFIDNKEISLEDLMIHVKAPDFPTGGIIYGIEGVREAFLTGRGRIVIRAKASIEQSENGRDRIIVNEIPYQLNKADMIKRTADLVNEKKIDGISDIRDESDRDGMRIVYELRKDAVTNVVLNSLFKYTGLQTSFSVNNIALVHGRPMLLNLKDLIKHYIDHRHEVVIRRTKFELAEAEKRAHILEGLLIALDHLDAVIALIRASQTVEIARNGLMTEFQLSEIQARAILDLRLQKLTGLEREKIKEEYDELMKFILYCRSVLADEVLRYDIIKKELNEMKDKYGDERRTAIEYSSGDMTIEDLIADEAMVITISHLGYIKRTSLTEYKVQGRGGKGAKGSTTRDEDFVEYLVTATNHNYMLFFTEKGQCFWMKVYEIPEGTRVSKGRAIQNLINIGPDDKIKAFINVKNLKDEEYLQNNYIIMCTKKGILKKTKLKLYSYPRKNGIIAINIREGDQLLEAKLTNGNTELLLASKFGRAVRFSETKFRAVGRNSMGSIGMRMSDPLDEVVGMVCVEDKNNTILSVSEKGFGKRSPFEEYRVTNRGAKGVINLKITEKTGKVIAVKNVDDSRDLMIINKSGIIIRIKVKDLRVMARRTQGVTLIKLKKNDTIASVTDLEEMGDEEIIPTEIVNDSIENVSDESTDNSNQSEDNITNVEDNTPEAPQE